MGLLDQFGIKESDSLLAQVTFTPSELAYKFNKKGRNLDESGKQETSYENDVLLTSIEQQAISESKGKISQKWYVVKLVTRKGAKCCTCGSTMPEGKVYIYVKGLYIPP